MKYVWFGLVSVGSEKKTMRENTNVSSDEKLKIDESHRIQQHERVKDHLRQEVNRELDQASGSMDESDKERIGAVAGKLKDKTIREITESETEMERTRSVFRFGSIVDYIFFLAYGLIGMEILLDMLGARSWSGFKQFIDTISAPLLFPFKGLLFDPGVGPFRLMLSYIFALFFYCLLHLAIKRLLRLFTRSVA